MHRIHTPQQAVLALKAFRKDMQERPALVREWGHYWEPDEDTRKMVSAMDPDWKTFPVSGDDYREKVV